MIPFTWEDVMADEESPQADKENIAEEMRYVEQLEKEAEYQAQLLEYNTNPHKY